MKCEPPLEDQLKFSIRGKFFGLLFCPHKPRSHSEAKGEENRYD